MLVIVAFVVGFIAGYWAQDHFKTSIAALQADLKKEFDALKEKLPK